MPNPIRGEADFPAGEVTYRLCVDINALCSIEAALGRRSGEFISAISAGDITVLRGVLWGALQRHHDEIDLADAGDLISEVGLDLTRTKVIEAIAAAFPSAEAKTSPTRPRRAKAASKDGTSSGSSSAG